MQKYASHVMAMSMVMPMVVFMSMDVIVSSKIVGRFMVTVIMRVLDE